MTKPPWVPPPLAVLRFRGPFRGKPAQWTVVVATLPFWREHPPTPGHRNAARRSFIQVTGRIGPRIFARVGLPVHGIDEATLHKTRIMLSQWKRIGPGLHPFGPEQGPAR